MARTPTADRPLLAQWLIRARESAGLSATAFLDELRAAGDAPSYSTYAQWESGKTTPHESTLEPVIRFWAARGVAGPTPTVAALSLEERAVLAAEAQVEATRENTAMLAALLAQLTGQPQVDPRAGAVIQAQADAASRTSPLPQPGPTGTTGR